MSNTKSTTTEKVFEEVWTYRSDISGSGVRGKVDLVFEVERILQELKLFLTETGMRLVYSTEKSLYIAGARWTKYARRGNKDLFSCAKCGTKFEVTCPKCKTALRKRLHVLGDFMIGAHALVNANCLLSRDLGVYKTYFSDLKVVSSI
jgi:hypothetical protein